MVKYSYNHMEDLTMNNLSVDFTEKIGKIKNIDIRTHFYYSQPQFFSYKSQIKEYK